MSNTLTNFWEKIEIRCLNHEEPLKMHIINNTEVIKTPFYACENYLSSSDDENKCFNRLNLDDYQGLIMHFINMVADADIGTDFTNFKFSFKGGRQKIDAKVLKYREDKIIIGIRNTTVLGK